MRLFLLFAPLAAILPYLNADHVEASDVPVPIDFIADSNGDLVDPNENAFIACGKKSTDTTCAFVSPYCDIPLTHSQAVYACGMLHPDGRPCSLDEVYNQKITQGVTIAALEWGVCYNVAMQPIWTDTPCSKKDEWFVVEAYGGAKTRQCEKKNDKNPVVCCISDYSFPATDNPTSSSSSPTRHPVAVITRHPTSHPTNTITQSPSHSPSKTPTKLPTRVPTQRPTASPSQVPSQAPSQAPSTQPTNTPSQAPSTQPTNTPSQAPSTQPTNTPTKHPVTRTPTNDKSTYPPTGLPSKSPTAIPTKQTATAAPTIPSTQSSITSNCSIAVNAQTGNDASNCGRDTASHSCATLQHALRDTQSLSGVCDNVGINMQGGNIKGSAADFEVQLDDGVAIELSNVVIDGMGGACLVVSGGGTLTLRNVTVTNCVTGPSSQTTSGRRLENGVRSTVDGGAVFVSAGAHLIVHDSKFINNYARGFGGAIAAESDAYVSLLNVFFDSNRAGQGGGAVAMIGAAGTLIGTGCEFRQNKAVHGGAVYSSASGAFELGHSEFSSNNAHGDGGAIHLSCPDKLLTSSSTNSGSQARLVNTIMNENTAMVGSGGQVFVHACTLLISGGTMQGGRALNGGALALSGGKCVASNNLIVANNMASQDGGAVSILNNGILELLTGCSVKSNTAGRHGGFVYAQEAQSVSIVGDNQIESNIARGGNGGAFYFGSVVAFSVESGAKFTANLAPNGGGGVYFVSADTIASSIHNGWQGTSVGETNAAGYGDERASVPYELCVATRNVTTVSEGLAPTCSRPELTRALDLLNQVGLTTMVSEKEIRVVQTDTGSDLIGLRCDTMSTQRKLLDEDKWIWKVAFRPGNAVSEVMVAFVRDRFSNIVNGDALLNQYYLQATSRAGEFSGAIPSPVASQASQLMAGTDSVSEDKLLFQNSIVVPFEKNGLLCSVEPLLAPNSDSYAGFVNVQLMAVDYASTSNVNSQEGDLDVELGSSVVVSHLIELVSVECESGTTLLSGGQTCVRCPSGSFVSTVTLDSDSSKEQTTSERKCVPCPLKDAACLAASLGVNSMAIGANDQMKKGVWIRDAALSDSNSSMAYTCPLERVCELSGSGVSSCSDGHGGPLCLGCVAGFGKRGLSCLQCGPLANFLTVLFASCWLLATICFTFTMQNARDTASVLKVKVARSNQYDRRELGVALGRITITSLQFMSLTALFSVEWPGSMTRFLTLIESMSLANIPFLDCHAVPGNRVYTEALVTALLPPCAWIITVGCIKVVLFIRNMFGSRNGGIHGMPSRLELLTTHDAHICLAVVIGWLSYTMQVKSGFQLFGCSPDESAGGSFLIADPSVRCWEGQHAAWAVVLGLLGQIGLYGLGFPICIYYVTRRYVNKDPVGWSKSLGFLSIGFKDGCAQTEVIVMALKFLLAMCVTLGRFTAESQVWAFMIVLFLGTVVQLETRRWLHAVAGSYQMLFSFVVALTTSSAAFFWPNHGVRIDPAAVVSAVVIAFMGLIVLVVLQSYQVWHSDGGSDAKRNPRTPQTPRSQSWQDLSPTYASKATYSSSEQMQPKFSFTSQRTSSEIPRDFLQPEPESPENSEHVQSPSAASTSSFSSSRRRHAGLGSRRISRGPHTDVRKLPPVDTQLTADMIAALSPAGSIAISNPFDSDTNDSDGVRSEVKSLSSVGGSVQSDGGDAFSIEDSASEMSELEATNAKMARELERMREDKRRTKLNAQRTNTELDYLNVILQSDQASQSTSPRSSDVSSRGSDVINRQNVRSPSNKR